MKLLITFFAMTVLFASSVQADLKKTMQAGVVTISGYLGTQPVYIRKYKEAGRCYTNGYVGSERFSLVVFKSAGSLIVQGDLPSRAESLVESFGYNPYKCSLFGLVE